MEQQTTLASTSVTPVYQNAISSSGVRDLTTIKKERITPPPLESYTSTGFKTKDLIESDNRKTTENIHFDLNNVKTESSLDLSMGSKQFPSILELSGQNKSSDRQRTEESGTTHPEVKVEKSPEIDMEEDSDQEGGVVTRDPTPEPPPVQCSVEVHCGSKEAKYR